MPNALTQAGALTDPSKYAPIHVNRLITGLWTQRSPLRDAATPYLYEKFYSGSRYDSLLDGADCELSPRLTLRKRFGHSLYNSQNFQRVTGFHSFKLNVGGQERIKLVVDADDGIWDGTGPATKNLLQTKTPGPALFLANGGVIVKGQYFVTCNQEDAAGGQHVTGEAWINNAVDNLQKLQVALPFSISTNPILVFIGTKPSGENISFSFPASAGNTTVDITDLSLGEQDSTPPSNRRTFQSVANTLYFGGEANVRWNAGPQAWQASLAYAAGALIVDFNFNLQQVATAGNSGVAAPGWSSTPLATTNDNTVVWKCRGSAISKWGIAAPIAPPDVANAAVASPYHAWAANTFYSPFGIYLVDSNNNIQLLTTGGTLGGAAPAWNAVAGGVTNDNTARWTNKGPKGWLAGHNYAVGDVVIADYTVNVLVPTDDNGGDVEPPIRGGGGSGGHTGFIIVSTTYHDMFRCTTAGQSGGAAPAWQQGPGSTVNDNTVVWTNVGTQKVWTDFGAGALVSIDTQIQDSNGNLQSAASQGKSGAAAPGWATASGSNTVDGASGLTWTCQGPTGAAANSKPWYYAFSFGDSATGHFGTASPVSVAITQAAASYIQIGGEGSANPRVDTVRIFRTVQDGSLLLLLADVPLVTYNQPWRFNDTNPDRNLNALIQAPVNNNNDPPPEQLNWLIYHLDRIWGAAGNTVFYSRVADATPGVTAECFPPLNSFVFPSRVVRLEKTAVGVLVLTVSDVYLISGRGTPNSPFISQPWLAGYGIASYDALAVNGSTLYLMCSDHKVISFDPGAGLLEMGFPIGDRFDAEFLPQAAYLAWHWGGSGDSALYVADGGTGWYRMAATAPPEAGFTWSPKANVAVAQGGISAVASVEVKPGVRRLLVGPPTLNPGPILQRDAASNKDNGANFGWSADIGLVVLAQPGSVAEVAFLSSECVRTGTRPELGVLLGELSGKFEKLVRTANDPPLLPASKTMFSERYHMAQNQKPILCRQMLVRFTFKAEDARNEVLSYTVFGAVENEHGAN